MSFRLKAIASAVPEHSIAQVDAAKLWTSFTGVEGKRARTVEALYRRSRVKKRHSVLFEGSDGSPIPLQSFFRAAESEDDLGPTTEARMQRFESEAPPLAERASSAALVKAGLKPSDVTHLVTVSCTGFFAPGLDTTLIDMMGLPPTVERTHVGFMGCHGALNGLRVGQSFAEAKPDARILITSVELCTLHMSYTWDPDLLVANSLFGDGAAAVVGVGGEEESKGDLWRLAGSGTCRLPDSAHAMSWRIGNHGFRMTLSPSVPDIIQAHLRDWLTHWLQEYGLGLTGVATWAIHPGGPRILTAVEKALDLSPNASEIPQGVLADFGNMSSATVLFILERLRDANAPRPCVALAFGPGLVAEAALFL